ncbi:haloacid dehalogenase type II [Tunturiibacter empetritectus]|uniref:2-haloacid dehalogenase n=1 Tax=Tunturiibacter lichenicola TaxID=2051959 RepID=A0A852VDF1_9BACT|nr:haloacid dehalogenase type II [Edaphobacter lichenicola]NYF88305.1 2-haloacid dehalogenase [Edaphobacter lichenicola]
MKAIAFDGFVIFDPRPVAVQVQKEFPGRGAEFMNLWRTRQFEYTWLRTLGNQYKDFWQVTEDALQYTASAMKMSLTTVQRDDLMQTYRSLPLWPDVPAALKELRRRGIRMVFLSNFTEAMLETNIKAANLVDHFEPHLTTDRVRAYKPSRSAYQMGLDAFGLKREEIAFAAFAPWDAVGAKWFGYPTVWVNRANAPLDDLDAQPDVVTPDLSGLLSFVG